MSFDTLAPKITNVKAMKLEEPIGISTAFLADTRQTLGGKFVWDAVRQQSINNCPLPATCAAIAKVDEGRAKNLLSKNISNFTSTVHGKPKGKTYSGNHLYKVHFTNHQILVSPLLYYRDKDTFRRLQYAYSNTHLGSNVWVSYIEKAYVAWRSRGGMRYENLDYESANPPSTDRVFFDLVGSYNLIQKEASKAPDVFLRHTSDLMATANENYSETVLKRFLNDSQKKATIATTWSDPDSLIGMHTYVIEKFTAPSVHVWEAIGGRRKKIELKNFWDEFNSLYQET